MRENRSSAGFVHPALIYESEYDFLDAMLPFVQGGLAQGEPVLVAVSRLNLEALRGALGDRAADVELHPAEEWYENPARTRTKFLGWAESKSNGRRARMVGEPPWPIGSAAAVREWARHEAVTNEAFARFPVTFVCPYDARSLPDSILEHAECTHPQILHADGLATSESFTRPPDYCRSLDAAVSERYEPPLAERGFSARELAAVRRLVASEALRAGLDPKRTADLVLAANELAANAVSHGDEPATIRIWLEPRELVCEVSDGGAGISDPLAGQLQPDPSSPRGLGLWLARMTSDALEIHSGAAGSSVEVHALIDRLR